MKATPNNSTIPSPTPQPVQNVGVTAASVPLWVGGSGGGGPMSIPLLGARTMANLIVPPGGFAGFAQQTAATQAMFQRAGRIGGKRSAAKRRKRKTAKKSAAPRRRKSVGKRAVRAKTARLVKGSAAAKRYMASIRRKRKK